MILLQSKHRDIPPARYAIKGVKNTTGRYWLVVSFFRTLFAYHCSLFSSSGILRRNRNPHGNSFSFGTGKQSWKQAVHYISYLAAGLRIQPIIYSICQCVYPHIVCLLILFLFDKKSIADSRIFSVTFSRNKYEYFVSWLWAGVLFCQSRVLQSAVLIERQGYRLGNHPARIVHICCVPLTLIFAISLTPSLKSETLNW